MNPGRYMRNLGALAVVLLLTAGVALASDSGPSFPLAGSFTDDDGNVHEENIEAIAAEGITAGCDASGTLYCPNDFVSRGQMATFLARALDLPASSTNWFPDDDGSTHEPNINAIADAGITLGLSDGTYNPSGLVRRDQMASFMVRGLDGLADATADYFTDDEGNTHETAINAMAENAISLGCNAAGTEYCPGDNVRRDQMASFLARGLGLDPITPTTSSGATTSSSGATTSSSGATTSSSGASTSSTMGTPETHTVDIISVAAGFDDDNITITIGDSIIWDNTDSIAHTSTSGSSPTPDGTWNTGNLAGGEAATAVLFDTEGTFPYFCAIHPSMTGTVTVNP